MNYDHVLLPSGVARTVEEVDEYLSGQQGQPESATIAEIAVAINARDAELPDEDTFLGTDTVGGAATGATLAVSSPYDAIGFVRALLFDLATPRGLAVYDPQLTWLFDPADRIDVEVTHGGAGEFPYLTEALLETWIPELTAPNPYVIAQRAPQTYIQTYRDESGVYTVEYRDGSPDRHFGTQVEEPARVVDLLWTWARGKDPSDEDWSRIEF
ncbi:hypothetical protein ACWEKT_39250 [Nocardia takedensis]